MAALNFTSLSIDSTDGPRLASTWLEQNSEMAQDLAIDHKGAVPSESVLSVVSGNCTLQSLEWDPAVDLQSAQYPATPRAQQQIPAKLVGAEICDHEMTSALAQKQQELDEMHKLYAHLNTALRTDNAMLSAQVQSGIAQNQELSSQVAELQTRLDHVLNENAEKDAERVRALATVAQLTQQLEMLREQQQHREQQDEIASVDEEDGGDAEEDGAEEPVNEQPVLPPIQRRYQLRHEGSMWFHMKTVRTWNELNKLLTEQEHKVTYHSAPKKVLTKAESRYARCLQRYTDKRCCRFEFIYRSADEHNHPVQLYNSDSGYVCLGGKLRRIF